MSEIGIKDQKFGVEVEFTGITREEAARALAAYFGTRPKHVGKYYDKWTVADREGKVWTLMSDSSIRGERKTDLALSALRQHGPEQNERGAANLWLYRYAILESGPHTGNP